MPYKVIASYMYVNKLQWWDMDGPRATKRRTRYNGGTWIWVPEPIWGRLGPCRDGPRASL